MFKKTFFVSTAALLIGFLTSCSLFNSPEDSGCVSLTIPARSIDGLADDDYENLLVDISLKGDYSQNQTISVKSGTTASFEKLKQGSKVYLEAEAYRVEPELDKKNILFSGTSESITVKSGENPVTLILKKIYTVSFYIEGLDTPLISKQRIVSGNKATKPELEKSLLYKDETDEYAFEFNGWSTSEDSVDIFDFNTPIKGNITLYAYYTQINKYKVTFDLNGGTTSIEPQHIIDGHTATEPDKLPEKPSTEKEAYEFMGWYADLEDEAPFDFATPITDNLILYAKWETRIAAGIEINPIEIPNTETITVECNNTANPVIFTAESGYDSYLWKIDGHDKKSDGTYYSTTNKLSINLEEYNSGIYNITLLATKGTGDNTKYYSYTVEIKKN